MLIRATYAGVGAIYHQVNRDDIYVFILLTIKVIIFSQSYIGIPPSGQLGQTDQRVSCLPFVVVAVAAPPPPPPPSRRIN